MHDGNTQGARVSSQPGTRVPSIQGPGTRGGRKRRTCGSQVHNNPNAQVLAYVQDCCSVLSSSYYIIIFIVDCCVYSPFRLPSRLSFSPPISLSLSLLPPLSLHTFRGRPIVCSSLPAARRSLLSCSCWSSAVLRPSRALLLSAPRRCTLTSYTNPFACPTSLAYSATWPPWKDAAVSTTFHSIARRAHCITNSFVQPQVPRRTASASAYEPLST